MQMWQIFFDVFSTALWDPWGQEPGEGTLRVPVLNRRWVTAGAARAAKKKFGSFDEMLSGATTPVLVDFYATWCGPCVMLSSELQKVGKALGEERIQIVKIDTEKYPKIASKFNVEALPTVLLFKGGEVVDRIEGMLDANQLQTRLNYFLSSP